MGDVRGQPLGRNLFHSFAQFSVPLGTRAEFTATSGFDAVIARVTTPGSASFVDGTLASSIPGADLYLLNPSGVFFSQTASLDVLGSFYVATPTRCASRTPASTFTPPRRR